MRLTHLNNALLVGLALAVSLPTAGCLDTGVPGDDFEGAQLGDADATLVQGLSASVAPLWAYPGDDSMCVLGDVTLADQDAVPRNAHRADGYMLATTQNQNLALFSLLRNDFGGDGIRTFKLPDLRAAAPAGTSYYVCTSGYFPNDLMTEDCVVGSVRRTANARDRSGMEPADGRVVSITAYPALFAAIGARYGGDGVNTFALPDAQAETPDGITAYICAGNVVSP